VKILFLTSRLPYPPYRGDKSRTYNFIKALSQNHEIHLISFCETKEDYSYKKELKKYCKEIHLIYLPEWLSWFKAVFFYFSKAPSQVAYYRSFRMKNLINKIAKNENYDMVYVHLFRMYQYSQYIPASVYRVTDLTDVVSKELFRSIGLDYGWRVRLVKREAHKIRNYERKVLKQSQEVWVISDQEKKDLINNSDCNNVFVVGIGVEKKDSVRAPEKNSILFFGYSHTGHNKAALDFLRNKIMPEIIKKIPDAKLSVFGAGKWTERKKRKNEFPINNFGFVADPGEVFSSNAVMVAPILHSAGTQTKILEAMNYGLPVVTSSFGNEGIQAKNGSQIVICDEPSSYVEQIVMILTDSEIGEKVGREGQKYVRDKFSWHTVIDRVGEIEKLLKHKK